MVIKPQLRGPWEEGMGAAFGELPRIGVPADYLWPQVYVEENMSRLRKKDLSGKRSLALRDFALGVERLERFMHRSRRSRCMSVCSGLLALESDEVNPRL
jgi:hypothetical protein